jgi:hypothetical protein
MIAPRVWFQHFITTPRRKLIAKTMNNKHRLFSSNLPSGSSCTSPNQYHQRNDDDDDDEIQIIGERIGEYFYLFSIFFHRIEENYIIYISRSITIASADS